MGQSENGSINSQIKTWLKNETCKYICPILVTDVFHDKHAGHMMPSLHVSWVCKKLKCSTSHLYLPHSLLMPSVRCENRGSCLCQSAEASVSFSPKRFGKQKRNQGAHLDREAKWTGRCGTTTLNGLL